MPVLPKRYLMWQQETIPFIQNNTGKSNEVKIILDESAVGENIRENLQEKAIVTVLVSVTASITDSVKARGDCKPPSRMSWPKDLKKPFMGEQGNRK